jgi:hypothetical protein
MAGLSIPSTAALGPNSPFASPSLSFEVLGGVYVTWRKASFSGMEAGRPVGFSTSHTSVSPDPAVGVGVVWDLGNLPGIGPSSIGAKTVFVFPQEHSLQIGSPNYPSETYRLTTPTRVETLGLFSFTRRFMMGR